jgi:cell division initiation protein
MDIEKQEFKRSFRGWDPEEVHLFLRSVAEEIERLNLENGHLREEAGELRRQLDELRTREKTLQETLVSAQRMSDELKDKARAEAELVVGQARLRAEEIVKQAQDQLMQIEMDISRSRLERESLEQRLRGVIDQHLAMLDMRKEARDGQDNVRIMPNREVG